MPSLYKQVSAERIGSMLSTFVHKSALYVKIINIILKNPFDNGVMIFSNDVSVINQF